MKSLIGYFLITAMLPSVAHGFDNRLEGFSLGIYPGVSWINSSDYVTAGDDREFAMTPSVSLGFGLSGTTALSLNLSLPIYTADWNDNIMILTSSVGVRRYLQNGPNAFHVGVGVGISFDGSHEYDGSPPITGYLGELSGGYLLGHWDSQLRFQAGGRFVESETLTLVSVSVGYLFF